ncbi:MAG: SDR family oxidoreductase [Firmicutes bacterium]|nr:SDR family oxidoreductase [Bacillota bacterium]
MDLKSQRVLVTGGSRGIGAAIARAFARQGAAVAVNYRENREAAEATVRSCRQFGGDALPVQADVTDEQEVRRMSEHIFTEWGALDVVINNAFRPYPFDPEGRKPFSRLEWKDYRDQLEGALTGVYHVTQSVLPQMQAKKSGSIVNIVTDLIARPTVPYHEYTTAKSAVVGFTRNLAAEMGAYGIRINCVAPGLVYPTDSSRHTKESIREAIADQTPLRRIATPEDVTGPVLFLASDYSRFMTGQILYVDGGLVMS